LTAKDWYAVGFYRRVALQYVNQGSTKEGKTVLTPRLEGFRAALDVYEYARADWPWLTDWASFLMGAVFGESSPLLPVRFRDVTAATFAPPEGSGD